MCMILQKINNCLIRTDWITEKLKYCIIRANRQIAVGAQSEVTYLSPSSTCSYKCECSIFFNKSVGSCGDKPTTSGTKRMNNGQRATPQVELVQWNLPQLCVQGRTVLCKSVCREGGVLLTLLDLPM